MNIKIIIYLVGNNKWEKGMVYLFAIATLLSLPLADYLMRKRRVSYWKAILASLLFFWIIAILVGYFTGLLNTWFQQN
jgi:hypothetical protein